MYINIQHKKRRTTQVLVKKYLFFSILLLLSTFNFQLSTHAQETPFPTDHLQLWLRADSVELTSGKISQWYDLSPNNYVIQQTSANARPTLNNSSVNGLPALIFNGSSNFLTGGNILNIGDKGWSYFVVAKIYNNGGQNWFFSKGDRNNGWVQTGYYNWFLGNSSMLLMNRENISISCSGSQNIYAIYEFELYDRNTSTTSTYLNGEKKQTVNANNINATNTYGINIGRGHASQSSYQFYSGEIAEFIVIDTVDSIYRNQIQDYLFSKYITNVSLGSDIYVPYGFCDTAITTAYNPDFISYQWSTGETDPIIHVNRSGKYTVTVTNSFGITSTDDINVYFPEHFQMQDTTICTGDTIFWNAGLDFDGYTFQWMKDGIQYADASNQIEIFEGGAYTCIITDSIGCRLETDTIHVAIDDYPISTSFIAGGTCSVQTDTAMCSGNTIGLATNIDKTFSYIWNTGATSSRITITESGYYTLTTTNSRGCRAVNSIHANILGVAPEINFAIDNLCFGDSTSFIGNAQSQQGIASYLWIVDDIDSISAQSFNYKFSSTGYHDIRNIVTSNNSCRTDSSFNITIKELPIPIFTYTPVCSGVPMDFVDNSIIPEGTTAEFYSWMIGDSVVGNEENLRYTFAPSTGSGGEFDTKSERLVHIVSLSNGCTSDTTIEVRVRSDYAEPRYVSPAYPTNGIHIFSDSIRFEWNFDYDILYYNLITSKSTDFSTADTITCSGNSILLSAEDFADTTYWKVTAYNHCLISLESEPYFFVKTNAEGNIISNDSHLQLWLRADSIENSNGKVSRWYDLSPNNYIIQQTTASAQPSIKESAINGLPALSFNGSSTFMNGENILNIGNKGWTYFIIAKLQNTNSTNWFLSKGDINNGWGSSGRYNWFIGNSSMLIMNGQIYQNTLRNNGANNTYAIYGYELYDRSTMTCKAYLNGSLQSNISVQNVNATNTIGLTIGRSHASSSGYQFFSGEIAEIIAVDTIDGLLNNQVYDYMFARYAPATVSLGLDIHIPYGFCDTAITTAYNPDFISYQWSTGETDSIIHVNRSGRYTVTVTNSFGVTSTDDINVYFPEHFQMQDTTICVGDTIYWDIKLPQNDYSFQWFKNGEEYGVEKNIAIYDGGEYSCIISDSLGCNFQTDTMHLYIDTYPINTLFGNEATADTSMCIGNTLGLGTNIEETTSYIWNTGLTSPNIAPIESGSYTLTSTNSHGCVAINTININILGEAPEINYTIDYLCFKDSTSFIGSAYSEQGIYSYLWIVDDTDSISAQSFNYKFSTTGNHDVRYIVTSNNSCHTDSSFNITIKEIAIPNFTYTPVCHGVPMDFVDNSIIPNGTTAEFYSWMIGDSVVGNEDNLRYTFDTSTGSTGGSPFSERLVHTVTLSNGCTSDTTIEVRVRSDYAEPRYVSPAYPTNGIHIFSDSIRFEWNFDYDILYYNLITSKSTDFSTADTITCSGNSIFLSAENFADTTYWKVTAYNHCLISLESEPYFFIKTNAEGNIISNDSHLQLWLRADSVEISSGKVARWYDLSQNNYIIQQTTTSAQPYIKESAINGLPALSFNGSSTFMNGENILNIGNKGWTYFIIAKLQNTNSTNWFLSKGDINNGWGSSGRYNWFIGNSSMLIMNGQIYQNTLRNNGANNTYAIYGYELYDRSTMTCKAYLNGSLQSNISVQNVNATNTIGLTIGRSHASSSGYQLFSGEIAEIIAVDTIDGLLNNQVYDYMFARYAPATVSLGLDIHIPYGFCDTTITTAYNPDFISYQWSTGETDSVIHVNRSGRYTVTVTNSFGVTSTDDINVYFPEHFQMHDTTICAGDTVYWNLKLRQDEYSFQWFMDGEQYGDASNQIEISEAGAYTCIITDSIGCSFQTDTMHLAIDNYPISAGFENSDTTLCYGNRLHIASGYEETTSAIWNDGTTDLEHYLTQPGTYTVTTTNTRGCTATNSINVNIQGRVPTPNFSIEGHCQNAEVTTTNLSTSEIGEISLYRWYANDSLIGTTENISHSFDEYGTQSLKLYLETSDHCFNDTTIPIYIYPQPKPDFSPKHFCQNAPTEISARTTIAEGDIINHLWNLGDGNVNGESITNTFESYGIKTITLSAESEEGCIGTKDIEVNVLQAEMPATEISGVCLGYETTFINKTPFNNINPQTAWEWDFGDDTETSPNKNTTHTYDTTGTYNVSLTVSFANHCTTTTDTTITIHELPEATITANDGCVGSETTLNAEIISVDNIATYKWQIDSIFESSEQRPTFVSDTTGTFTVTLDVLTEFSCPTQVTDSITIHGKPDVAFTQSRDWGGSPLYVEFENTSEGATSYHWDFGDAGESNQTNPYFIFTEPGKYEVSLTGTNEFGCSSKYTSSAITVVEPIVDIMLMDLKANEENGFAKISLIIVNLGTLPVEDLVLELKVNTQIYHESIGHIAQGAVVPHTFGTMIPIPNSASIANTICVEAIVPDVEGHSDMNPANNTLCITDAENLSVGIPYPIPAREQITCDIYTKIHTDLDISIFNIFGKLVKQEQISQHKGYLKYVVNVMDLAGGMYFIRVNSKDESITHKFEIR